MIGLMQAVCWNACDVIGGVIKVTIELKISGIGT